MVQIVCQVITKPDQVSFVWSEGPASFEPYHLTGQYLILFQKAAEESRKLLGDLVKDCLYGTDDQVRRSSLALAQSGYQLYRRVFTPGTEQNRVAQDVRKWLDELQAAGAMESLEIVIDPPRFLPWNVVYDRPPDEQAFAAGEGVAHWEPFWGIRYNLAGGRRVNPLRRKPLWENPRILLVIDPQIRAGLQEAERQRLVEFARARNLVMVESKGQLASVLKAGCPDLMYWLCHATPEALVLDNEEISPIDLIDLLAGDDFNFEGQSSGIAFLNACQTAEGSSNVGSFMDALYGLGMSGMIATEQQTIDTFANSFGLDFLESFLERGEPVGRVLQRMRGRVPLGLLYATYCPPHIRVRAHAGATPEFEGTVPISTQVPTAGTLLGVGTAAVAAREWPLPDIPYRSLAFYERQHRALFAGRDHDVRRFAEILDRAGTRIMILHGESGVGKTSFLRAGVMPYLEEECIGYRSLRRRSPSDPDTPEHERPLLFVRATNNLIDQLAQALYEYGAKPYTYQRPTGEMAEVNLPQLFSELLGGPVNREALRATMEGNPDLLGRFLAAMGNELPFGLVLVVDQAEEIFTLTRGPEDAEHRQQALAMLQRAPDIPGDFKIIISLRTEYFGRLIDPLRRGGRNIEGVREYLLTDFSKDEIVEAIERPTSDRPIPYTYEIPRQKYKGFRYEDGVAEKIASATLDYAVSRYDSVLPLVQVICTRLYEVARQRPDPLVTADDLRDIGGVQGGMRTHVENLLKALFSQSSDQQAFRRFFTHLYLRQPDGSVTTALLPADMIKDKWTGSTPFEQMLKAAAQGEFRLLRVSQLRIGGQEESPYVSLGHDALAKIAAQWDEELSRGAKNRRVAIFLAVVGAVALIMTGLAGFAWWAKRKADKQQELAVAQTKEVARQKQLGLARQLAAQAQIIYPDQLDLGLLLTLEAYRLAGPSITTESPEFRNSILAGLAQDPRIVATLRVPGGLVRDVAFSPDSRVMAYAVEDGSIHFWNTATHTEAFPPLSSPAKPTRLTFIENGNTLAATNEDNSVSLWDVPSGQPLREAWHLGPPPERDERSYGYKNALHTNFSPDGKILMAASGHRIRLLDTETGEEKAALDKPAQARDMRDAVFSPDGRLLAFGDFGGFFFIWNPSTGKVQAHPPANKSHGEVTDAISFAPDGKTVAVGDMSGRIRIFEVATGRQVNVSIENETSFVSSLTYTDDGKALASGNVWNGKVALWEAATGKKLDDPLNGHTQPVYLLKYSPDRRTLVSAGEDDLIVLWNVSRRTRLGTTITPRKLKGPDKNSFSENQNEVGPVAFSPDGHIVAVAVPGGEVDLWDAATHEPLATLKEESYVGQLAFSPDGKVLAVGIGDQAVGLWDVERRERVAPPMKFKSDFGITSLAFDPDGKVVAAGNHEGVIALWEVATGRQLTTLPEGKPDEDRAGEAVVALHFSDDHKTLLAAGGYGSLYVWDLATRQKLDTPKMRELGSFPNIIFSIDGRLLVAGERNKLIMADTSTRKEVGQLKGHGSTQYALALTADSKVLASGGDKGEIVLWDLGRQQRIGPPLLGHNGRVDSLAFSPDGKYLVSGSEDGTLIFWNLSEESWKATACGVANRNLTPQEWKQYLGDEPYNKTCPDAPVPQ